MVRPFSWLVLSLLVVSACGKKSDPAKNVVSTPVQGSASSVDSNIQRLIDGCNTGNASQCLAVAFMYARGTGLPMDPMKAEVYFRDACDKGILRGSAGECITASVLYERGQNVPQNLMLAKEFKAKAHTILPPPPPPPAPANKSAETPR